MPTCSGPIGWRRATSWSPSPRAACTPTATPSCDAWSRAQACASSQHVDELGRTLGEELLEPTRVYAADLLAFVRTPGLDVHALSHVTGGGLAANLARVLPAGTLATVHRSTWTPPPVFALVQAWGKVPRLDLERTLNLGVGFVVVLPAAHADAAVRASEDRGIPAWVLGQVTAREDDERGRGDLVSGAKGVDGGAVLVVGEHPTA